MLCCALLCCVVQALALRRPALLSAVMLRQNPHNVAEWHKRVNLFKGDPTKQVRPGGLLCVVQLVCRSYKNCCKACGMQHTNAPMHKVQS